MRYFAFLFCLAGVALFCFASPGAANDGPFAFMGGSASPKGPHEFIRMDSEEVTIQLLKNSYVVDAVFHFFNTGETMTEWVGFPKRGDATYPENFIKFETWVNGQEAEFTEEGPGILRRLKLFWDDFFSFSGQIEDYRWMVKHVTFPGHAVTTTRVRYEAGYHISDAKYAMYVYGTGSFWKDTIGNAVFVIGGNGIIEAKNLDVRCEPALKSTEEQISPGKLRYEIKDFKPHGPNALIEIWFGVGRPY